MKFSRPQEEDFSLQLTPLIDVVFLLLIFFMVSTAFIDFTRRMDIELPDSDAGRAMEKIKVYEIEMSVDGDLLVNGRAVSLAGLTPLLEKRDPSVVKRSAVIRADKGIDYGDVVKVMGLCKQADIGDIGLAVR
jgi:biopolymer transport protein ExbD